MNPSTKFDLETVYEPPHHREDPHPHPHPHPPSSSTSSMVKATSSSNINTFNDTATSISFLVSDWSQFGLAERTSYHYDLIGTSSHPFPNSNSTSTLNATTANTNTNTNANVASASLDHPSDTSSVSTSSVQQLSPSKTKHLNSSLSPSKASKKLLKQQQQQQREEFHSNNNNTNNNNTTTSKHLIENASFCGISSLLECVPYTPLTKRTKRYRRYFRERNREFNLHARLIRERQNQSQQQQLQKQQQQQQQQHDSNNPTNESQPLLETQTQMQTQMQMQTEEMSSSPQKKSLPSEQMKVEQESKEKSKRKQQLPKQNPNGSIPIECHRPSQLPLPISHMTRVTFAYELTKMVICIDASPTLTSTFGNNLSFSMYHNNNNNSNNSDGGDHKSPWEDSYSCCAMDRIGPMLQTYLTSLLIPIPVRAMDGVVKGGNWTPEIAITVIAVYNGPDDVPPHLNDSMSHTNHNNNNNHHPNERSNFSSDHTEPSMNTTPQPLTSSSKFSVLVKDYRIQNVTSAKVLSDKISRWAVTEVENNITSRLSSSSSSSSSSNTFLPQPLFQSDLREMLHISSVALDTSLPKQGRPLVLVVSDCRSIFCGNLIDLISATHTPGDYSSFRTNIPTFPSLVDVPIHVLNLLPPPPSPPLSSSLSAAPTTSAAALSSSISSLSPTSIQSLLLAPTPLQISDDTEALSKICEASHGCFLNAQILHELSQTIVGQVPPSSPLHMDSFVSFRKRGYNGNMRPNTLQWYTLFSLSMLTPLMNHLTWGWMAFLLPEKHLMHKKSMSGSGGDVAHGGEHGSVSFGLGVKGGASVAAGTTTISGATSILEGYERKDDGHSQFLGSEWMLDDSERKKFSPPTTHHLISPRMNITGEHTIIHIHSYALSPVRIKSLLHLRAQQNFRAKHFGGDDDKGKMSVHLTLPLDFETMFHYELSFTPTISSKIGWAQIKLALSGNLYFIHDVKNEFMARHILSGQQKSHPHHHHSTQTNVGMGSGNPITSSAPYQKIRHSTVIGLASAKICKFLLWIKREDELVRELCSMEDYDMLEPTKESKLSVLLDSFRLGQKYRHFQVQRVDIICTGGFDGYSSVTVSTATAAATVREDSMDLRNESEVDFTMSSMTGLGVGTMYLNRAEDQLRRLFANGWAHIESEEKKYIRIYSSLKHIVDQFYVVEIRQSHIASRLFHIYVYFCGIEVDERIQMFYSILKRIHGLEDFAIIPKPLEDYFLTIVDETRLRTNLSSELSSSIHSRNSIWMGKYKMEACWTLDSDPDLLPLLVRRRKEMGQFWIIDSSPSHALLAKFLKVERQPQSNDTTSTRSSNSSDLQTQLFLVQSQLHVNTHHVCVYLQMEIPSNMFLSLYLDHHKQESIFGDLAKETKLLDEKCANALRSRRRLVNMFDPHMSEIYLPVFQQHDVQLLLPYSSRLMMELRFFRPSADIANDILSDLTRTFLLSLETNGKKQVVELGINPSDEMSGDMDPGRWFLMRHDSSTHSIIYFPFMKRENELPSGEISLVMDEEEKYVYRDISIFTFEISDLYCSTRSQNNNHDPNLHLEQVLRLKEILENEHRRNYARASFLALRRWQQLEGGRNNNNFYFQQNDFEFALSPVCDVEIANSFITTLGNSIHKKQDNANTSSTPMMDTGLHSVITRLFKPVPGGYPYFYFSGEQSRDLQFEREVNDTIHNKMMREDIMILDCDEESNDDEIGDEPVEMEELGLYENEENNSNGELSVNSSGSTAGNPPPIFVKFLLDGRIASLKDLEIQTKSSNLKAYITTFGDPLIDRSVFAEGLPKMHSCVALALRNNLEAYTAALTLERLNIISSSVSDIDLKAAMKCVIAANFVSYVTIPIQLFSPKFDSIEDILSGTNDGDVEKGFSMLINELSSGRFIRLLKGRYDTYFITSMTDISGSFWGFVQINQLRGFVSILVYHPSGLEAAEETKAKIKVAIENICHRVNQLLLLESMHDSHQASFLMIPLKKDLPLKSKDLNFALSSVLEEVNEPNDLKANEPDNMDSSSSMSGRFECPIIFRQSFTLNHRCKMNQTIIALESSILHPFAVSNRQGIFVYKDKTGHVFYMRLAASNKTDFAEDNVDLISFLVYGIDTPDESITVQLPRLLQRKMISLSVDVLSLVLQKNPHYSLLPADIDFIESFQEKWKKIETDDLSLSNNETDNICDYEFPIYVYDPVLILLYFRQNIIGSTFFHRLQESIIDDEGDKANKFVFKPPNAMRNLESGLHTRFDSRHLRMFYNNAPSPLNPDLQPISTLTSKGKAFCTQAGNGIALIDFLLFRGDGSLVENIYVGASSPPTHASMDTAKEFSPLRKLSETESLNGKALFPYRLRVKIANTTLNSNALHQWIELTFNQALSGWLIEQRIKRIIHNTRVGLKIQNEAFISLKRPESEGAGNNIERSKETKLICDDFATLQDILVQVYHVPAPTIQKIDQRNILQSVITARLTLDILEHAIFCSLYGEKRQSLGDHKEITILRLEKRDDPKVVRLIRLPIGNSVRIMDHSSSKSKTLYDAPTDSPEYVCVYTMPNQRNQTDSVVGNTSKDLIKSSMMLFSEVKVEGNNIENKASDSMVQALAFLKSAKSDVFIRSISFVLWIGRTRQSLYTYNWNPRIFQEASRRFHEIEDDVIQTERKRRHVFENRHLGSLARIYNIRSNGLRSSKPSEIENPKHGVSKGLGASKQEIIKHGNISTRSNDRDKEQIQSNDNMETKNSDSVSSFRKNRPSIVIRRPKLIGRSVEGAAMQAVLASRARASSRAVLGSKSGAYDQKKPKGSTNKDRVSSGSVRSSRKKDDDENSESQSTIAQTHVNDDQSEASSIRRSAKKSLSGSIPRTIVSKKAHTRDTESFNGMSYKLLLEYPCLQGLWESSILTTRRFSLYHRNYFARQLMSIKTSEDVTYSLLSLFISFSSMMKSCSCELPTFFMNSETPTNIMLGDLTKFFLSFLSNSYSGIVLKQINILKQERNTGAKRNKMNNIPCSYATTVLKGKHGFSIVVLQLSMKRCPWSRKCVASCRVWYTIQSSLKQNKIQKIDPQHNGKMKRLIKMEKNSQMLVESVMNLPVEVGVQAAIFNMSVATVKLIARSERDIKEYGEITTLLRQIVTHYPPKLQYRIPGLKHRLYRMNFFPQEFIQESLLSFFSANDLFKYMTKNAPTYNMRECGDSEVCLSMNLIEIEFTAVTVFLMLYEENHNSYDLLILCRSEGQYLDRIVYSEDASYSMTRSDNIIQTAEQVLKHCLNLAAVHFRRDQLWELFSQSRRSISQSPSIENLEEFCSKSHLVSMTVLDPRLKLLLHDVEGDLQFDWSLAFQRMGKDPIFSHSFVFMVKARKTIVNLFRLRDEDIFIMIKSDEELIKIKSADIIVRDPRMLESENFKHDRAIERCVNWILHWVWNDFWD